MKAHPLTCLPPGAGYWLGAQWGSQPHMWPPHGSWTSSQHGGRTPRVSLWSGPGGGSMVLLGPRKSDSIPFTIITGLSRFKGRDHGPHCLENECELHIVKRACGVGYTGSAAREKQNWPQADREKNEILLSRGALLDLPGLCKVAPCSTGPRWDHRRKLRVSSGTLSEEVAAT